MAINKVAYEFKPLEDFDIPKSKREDALAAIADYVKEEALGTISEGKSPVMSGRWKKSLSPGYKKQKSKVSSVGFANLELDGALLDDLDVVIKNSTTLSYQVKGTQAGKADGNNRGTYGKATPNPSLMREFIPKEGQAFNKIIQAGIKRIAKSFEE